MIGGGTVLYDTDFHPLEYEKRIINDFNTIKCSEVVIKEGAFIGAGCVILKGVVIGKHAIIGAGSVVSKNIPDGEIWAGNPARRIR